jgi:hypothetical protein
VPDGGQEGTLDGHDRAFVAAAAYEASVTGSEEGVLRSSSGISNLMTAINAIYRATDSAAAPRAPLR